MTTNAAGAKALNLIVLGMLAGSLFVGIAGWPARPAAAQNCDRSGLPTPGDWIVTDTQVCTDTVIVMDGNLQVTNTGNLTIIRGGLKFVEDTAHIYSISVAGGVPQGGLTFINSKVWTETFQVNPYLHLAINVSGWFLADATTFAFPGTFTGSPGSTITFRNGSILRNTETALGTIFVTGSDAFDDNDDGPGLTFNSSTAFFYASQARDLYENKSGSFTGSPRQHIRLQGSTRFTAVDTFLAADFCCVATPVGPHNRVDLTGTARAFLYGVTFDTTERPPTQDAAIAAFTSGPGTAAYLYRWANVRVGDFNGVPVNGTNVRALFAGPESGNANFTDNGGAPTPPANVLTYLGKTPLDWNVTGVDGTARMPLVSDWIDPSTGVNSRFVGTFQLDATKPPDAGSSPLTFSAYPSMNDANASKSVLIQLLTLEQFLPDLTPDTPIFSPATPKEGETVQITAPVWNLGAGGAASVIVQVYDGTALLNETTIPFIGPFGLEFVNATLVNAAAGNHIIRVSVDPAELPLFPNGRIIEGPGVFPETNNLKGYQLSVTPFGPDLDTAVSFAPAPGFLNNPVELIAGVTNIGDDNATNVNVNFYVQGSQPTASDTPLASATIPFIDVGGVGSASVNWTPTSTGNFTVWAWADPVPPDAIPEPLPYLETNNLRSNVLIVAPAPDLVTAFQDLTLSDPFPRVQQAGITLQAVVRNSGQADAGPFGVQFSVDGVPVGGQQNNLTGLPVGQRWTTPAVAVPSFATCGAHTIGVQLDPPNAVQEGPLGGPYESNNLVATSVQVYPADYVTWSSGTINADIAVSSSIEITGPVDIDNAALSVVQDQDSCGRYYIKVLGGGSLSLVDASLSSNWPLVVYVAPGGRLTATNATFNLDTQGKGVLYSRGVLEVSDSTIDGDVIARGINATLRDDTLLGDLLHIDTTATSRIWTSTLPGVQTIQLASDAPGLVAVDFDIRNITFNAALTSQLVFGGDQVVHLTSVGLTKPGDWWAGMLTQSAHVVRYWWLTVVAVDGTGTTLQGVPTVLGLDRFNTAANPPVWQPATVCAPSDCYFNTNTSWLVDVTAGVLLYRAASEDRYGDLPPLVRATYRASGAAFVETRWRQPDPLPEPTGLVLQDTTITLVFSELTPNLLITAVRFDGDNGNDVPLQPVDRELRIVVTVRNQGAIIVRDVTVNCYDTDVDTDVNGFMDNDHQFYADSELFIGTAGPQNISANTTLEFTCRWTPFSSVDGLHLISAVVDPPLGIPTDGGAKAEVNETDNIRILSLQLFLWPDLTLGADPVVTFTPPTPLANNPLLITVRVQNTGTGPAAGAVLGVYTLAGTLLGTTTTVGVGPLATADRVVSFLPTTPGVWTVLLVVRSANDTAQNTDYDFTDNARVRQFNVSSQPDLTIALRGPSPPIFMGSPFVVNVNVTNLGGTPATGIVVAVNWSGDPLVALGQNASLAVDAFQTIFVAVQVTTPIRQSGSNQFVFAVVDWGNLILESNETNNVVTVNPNGTVSPPAGRITVESPIAGTAFPPGAEIFVQGYIRDAGNRALGNIDVTIQLQTSTGGAVAGANPYVTQSTRTAGLISGPITVPEDAPDGAYRIRVNATGPSLTIALVSITVERQRGFLDQLFLGLPVWLWLVVIIGAAILIGGGTAYLKFIGLGKLVECGECGEYIPEDSVKCPKCGVEFEKDMAKCSNCKAWIPVDVKQCPECGVEFATGEVEMKDYEAQMRNQYDEVKHRFQEEASRELGRTLSDREFDDWWRTQPTFVTFENWLREEEDMRRMGSKPCPVCSTLNSVTAVVCHKCGTLLKEVGGPPGAKPPSPATRTVAQPTQPAEFEEGAEAGLPSEAVPKKVVKKPVVGAPVVQKKVIRKPLGEEDKEGGDEEI